MRPRRVRLLGGRYELPVVLDAVRDQLFERGAEIRLGPPKARWTNFAALVDLSVSTEATASAIPLRASAGIPFGATIRNLTPAS